MAYKIIDDLSEITTIPLKTLSKICDKEVLCIAHSVVNNLKDNNNITSMDIGIGQLHIKVEEDKSLYKFIPSSNMSKIIKEAVTSSTSPLVAEVEKSLLDKVMNTYKDLI